MHILTLGRKVDPCGKEGSSFRNIQKQSDIYTWKVLTKSHNLVQGSQSHLLGTCQGNLSRLAPRKLFGGLIKPQEESHTQKVFPAILQKRGKGKEGRIGLHSHIYPSKCILGTPFLGELPIWPARCTASLNFDILLTTYLTSEILFLG